MRILVFSAQDAFLFELDMNMVVSARMTEEVNGEHCLDIATSQRLEQGQRLLFQDGTLKWREFVVLGDDELHDIGNVALGSYHAVWSAEYDLSAVYGEDIEVGGAEDAHASEAVDAALDGTWKWYGEAGDLSGLATIEMFGNSAWERIGQCVQAYGCEVEAVIAVSGDKVSSRKVRLVESLGSSEVKRRFDWGHDLTSIRRRPQEVPCCCRIIPIGSSDDVTIADVNEKYWHMNEDGAYESSTVNFLEDGDAVGAFAYKCANGKYDFPTRRVKFDIDDDRDLLAYAKEHLTDYTRPTPTYEATVLQYAQAGMSVYGVALGDVVHVVDSGFNPDAPLRVEARVVRQVVNLLDPSDTVLTVGQLGETLSTSFMSLTENVTTLNESERHRSTAAYIDELLARFSKEMANTEGYTYLVPGYGIIVYDKEVSDPLVGSEATSVVWVKGGTIAIACERNASFAGIADWKWRTAFKSGWVATDVLNATNIRTGKIASAENYDANGNWVGGGNWWDLDEGLFRIGGKSVQQIADASASSASSAAEGRANSHADSVASALDASFDQEKVLARITGYEGDLEDFDPHAVANGLYTDENGHLYVSATYIVAGTLNANLVKAGILADVKGSNYWDMATGEFRLASGTTVGGSTVSSIASSAAKSAVDSQTQTDIFNKLTDNGAAKGITMTGGQLYVNATYLRSGVLEVLDSSGRVVFRADLASKAVKVGSYTATGQYLSAGPTSMSDTTNGVFLAGADNGWSTIGNSGIRINGGVLALGGGAYLQGYSGSSAAGKLDLAGSFTIDDTTYVGPLMTASAAWLKANKVFLGGNGTNYKVATLTVDSNGNPNFTGTLKNGGSAVSLSGHGHSWSEITSKPSIVNSVNGSTGAVTVSVPTIKNGSTNVSNLTFSLSGSTLSITTS